MRQRLLKLISAFFRPPRRTAIAPVDRPDPSTPPPPDAVGRFLADLTAIAPSAGEGAYAFPDPDGKCRGWVQLLPRSHRQIEIHRLWTLHPGQGNGSNMLRTVCEIADRHGVEIALRPLSFGRKPYPMSTDQLHIWYQRYGFHGTRRKLIRKPAAIAKRPRDG